MRRLVTIWAAISFLSSLMAGCGSAPHDASRTSKSKAAPDSKPGSHLAGDETEDQKIERLLKACRLDPAVCAEAVALDRKRSLDSSEKACLDGEWASCSFLFHAGPDGQARIQGESGPLRWFVAPMKVQGRWYGKTITVSVFRGTPVFVRDRFGSMASIAFPQLYLTSGDTGDEAPQFEVSTARLSAKTIPLRVPPVRGRRVRGFERVLSPEPGVSPWMRTDCGPLFIIDDVTKDRQRYQRLLQVTDGVQVTGWTDSPINYDLGPCFQEEALVYATDGTPDPATVEINAEGLAKRFKDVWRTGFEYYEHVGEGAPCVRRIVEGEAVVSGDGRRDRWRVIRTGIHLIFLGPTVRQRDQRSTAFDGAALYTVVDLEEDAIVVTGGADRGDQVTGYRPNHTRRWWRSMRACEKERADHKRLPRLTRKEIQQFGIQ